MARVDTDTMGRKNRLREILGDFRLGRLDILVGTQMIAKGLDFPNVTLVGLVDADLSMHIPDFRANERTFQLLVQVAGRSGRGDQAGEVVVQTFTPQASPIQFSRHADYAGFAASELAVRREYRYPPYRHLIHHLFRGPNPEKLQYVAAQWAKRVAEALAGRLEVRGPTPAPIEKSRTSTVGRFGILPGASPGSSATWRGCGRNSPGPKASARSSTSIRSIWCDFPGARRKNYVFFLTL